MLLSEVISCTAGFTDYVKKGDFQQMNTPSEGTDALQKWHGGSPQTPPELSICEPAASDLHSVSPAGSSGVNETETLGWGIWPWSPSVHGQWAPRWAHGPGAKPRLPRTRGHLSIA